MEALLCGMLLALGGVLPTWAGGLSEPRVERAEGCPLLMTPAECRQHLDTLRRLPGGSARAAYLERHRALMAEREEACRCAAAEMFPETATLPGRP